MVMVLSLLAITVYLFISEIVRVDVAAIIIMVLLGLVSYVWSLLVGEGHIIMDAMDLFNGFSSNAVISIIAVMIIGAGLDKTGLMSKMANQITHIGGTTEKWMIPLICGATGFISSFMQNIGAAALFLPVVSRISLRTGISMSRLLMPMGFCAILGGTLTTIGSSSLILLNDLIRNSNDALPADVTKMALFGLFEVTPIGLALLIAGVLYFMSVGRFVLPASKSDKAESLAGGDTADYIRRTYGFEGDIFEAVVPAGSLLADKMIEEIEGAAEHKLMLVASKTPDGVMRISPARDIVVPTGSILAFLGAEKDMTPFAQTKGLSLSPVLSVFSDELTRTRAGIGEVVIPPRSRLVGKSLMNLRMRKTYGLNVLAVHRGAETLREGFRHLVLQSGDTLIVHSTWDDLAALEKNRDFVVITADYPHEELRPHKVTFALLFFSIAISLALFTNLRLSVALLTGAMGMIVSGVLTMDEAYEAVSWKSVFLLASLIPLGLAVETTGTAAWIAQEILILLGGVPSWVLQVAIAMLATFFTLVMSSAGATVLLVPLAVNIALGVHADPRIFALTVAISTSNSFFLPTHQVNALVMGPAGYRVKDFMRVGGIMTLLFWVVSLTMLNVVF